MEPALADATVGHSTTPDPSRTEVKITHGDRRARPTHPVMIKAGGALLGAVAGHASAGMSRHDLKELGEHLDSGQAGLVVVGVSDMAAKIEREMRHAEKVEKKQLHVDVEDIERDVTSLPVPDRPPVFG